MSDNTTTNMEEETPKLRSVSVGGPATLPPLSRSFAMPGKLSSRPLHVQQEASSKPITSSSVQWTVDAILPTISADYMLERTNVYINNSSSQQVADRIVESLKSQSLSYKESDEAKNSLLGESHNGLRFYLNLFADSQDSSTVILEVQRLTGCCFAFRQICREVCRSAKGLSSSAPPATMPRKFPMPSSLPPRSAVSKQQAMEQEVARALTMISCNLVDSQLLGMELLESLSKSTPLVLQEECLCKMKELILDNEEIISGLEAKRASQMKRHALAIIANGLGHNNAEDNEASTSNSLLHSDETFIEEILDCLRKQLLQEDPHCAAQAARCLYSLAASSEATKSLVQQKLDNTLNNLPTSHHSLLEQECSKLQSLCY